MEADAQRQLDHPAQRQLELPVPAGADSSELSFWDSLETRFGLCRRPSKEANARTQQDQKGRSRRAASWQ
ncbi:MAG: hypothetical protein ACI8X5_000496 [Planctomycetota bacterium]|jgi:hypothetical protein